ncbi:hypothetical protein [Acetobacter sp. P5B1]|uniref:hypothetical protein n=1 Tax=Acetobacter sp. P5B1 TaxID=2762620 RepID=UPI001C03DF5B|nr:hypothetical protein [Acetobacter sp. P5B1]
MATNPYSIGRNCRLTLLWAGSRVDLRDVTGFTANQETTTQRADPLNSTPVEFATPNGWRGSFTVARANRALDDLVADIEAGFWSAGTINSGTIYQYISEPDGSTSKWQFSQVGLSLSAGGSWQKEGIVYQTLSFFSPIRTKIA